MVRNLRFAGQPIQLKLGKFKLTLDEDVIKQKSMNAMIISVKIAISAPS